MKEEMLFFFKQTVGWMAWAVFLELGLLWRVSRDVYMSMGFLWVVFPTTQDMPVGGFVLQNEHGAL